MTLYRAPTMSAAGSRSHPLHAALHVCSVASCWPSALRLVETLRSAGEHGPVTLLALDPPPGPSPLPNTSVLVPTDLDLAEDELRGLRLIYDRTELEGALVPRLLEFLARRSPASLLHLDCHTEVHGSLHAIRAALDQHAVVVVPRAPRPVPQDGLGPDERRLLVEGAFSAGQVAVRPDAADFIRWWAERTRWDAILDPPAGLFGAGRWLDLAASSFATHILREPGAGISAWNLRPGGLERRDGTWYVHGAPMTTISLRGFDPSNPALLDPDLGPRPRLLLSEQPGLTTLLEERSRALSALTIPAGAPAVEPVPRWLDARVRRMALAALREAHDRRLAPPFEVSGDHSALVPWLNECVALPGAPVTRLLHAVWAGRGDLRTVFREPLGADGPALVAWAATDPEFARWYADIHRPVVPALATRSAPAPGLNVVGYLNAELGLGEAARLLLRASALGGVPHAAVPFGETNSRQSVEVAGTTDIAPFDTTLLCVNADLTPLASARAGGALDDDRLRIGYWFWEVDRFPPDQRDALHYVDEIWVASEFVGKAFRSITDKPICVIPHPVAEPVATHLTRRDLGLSDRFTFAFWFDAFSSTERKNPADVIRAFRQAFTSGEGPVLLIKSINGDHDRAAMEQLRWLAKGRPDIELIDGYWSAMQMRALVQHIDCFVSLHRSEGFGQGMADAMMAAKPVIATAHSGNLQYMTEQNSLLVPCDVVPVGTGNPPYPSDARWAAPDVGVAAQVMRDVVDRPPDTVALAERAAADIRRTNGLPVTAAHLADAFLRLLDRGARPRVST